MLTIDRLFSMYIVLHFANYLMESVLTLSGTSNFYGRSIQVVVVKFESSLHKLNADEPQV